jgi:hypothetical protein
MIKIIDNRVGEFSRINAQKIQEFPFIPKGKKVSAKQTLDRQKRRLL